MKKRDSRFELIRILSMIFILAYHYTMYGGWSNHNSVKIEFFGPYGQVGVSLFVMITGYFLAERESDFVKAWHRVNKLWIKTLVYSWIILICAIIFHFGTISKPKLLTSIFPVVFDEYWFITCYILLVLLTPVLNLVVAKFDKKNLLILISIIVFWGDVVPLIKNDGPLGSPLSVGVMFGPYLIAAFIRKYKVKIRTWQACSIILVSLLFEYFSFFILKRGIMNLDIARFTVGIVPLIMAVCIFFVVLNMKPYYSKVINWFASGVLASYLITEHPLFRMYFWHKLLHVRQFENPLWKFILMGIVIAIVAVLVCSIIDKVYEFVYKKIRA